MGNILHVLNGDAPRPALERSSVAGTFVTWPDILHEGPVPLASGDEWIRVRSRYLAAGDPASEQRILEGYRANDAALDGWRERDEVVFWLEHDLFDQLLLIRHLWWVGRQGAGTSGRFSLVCGNDYIGLLKPQDFAPRFDARRPITVAQVRIGSAAWEAFCSDTPSRLLPFATPTATPAQRAETAAALPYLGAAIHRLLEEFPAASNGLARTERQILEVLSEGARTPEQTFVAASRLEDAIYLGDSSFWTIVTAMHAVRDPLLTMDVEPRPGRLPEGTLQITDTGRAVLANRADHAAINGVSRWLGGTQLAPDRLWRWTGSSLLPPAA